MGKRDVFNNKEDTMHIHYDNEGVDPGIWWVCTSFGEYLVGYNTEEEAEEALETYRSYREEGQTVDVSRRYAGLI